MYTLVLLFSFFFGIPMPDIGYFDMGMDIERYDSMKKWKTN
jgi:hypothetical protein